MTIFYPDISSFQKGISLKGALAVSCKVTQGTSYANPDFERARTNAATNGTFFFAYHFLTQGNAVSQAAWCHSRAGRIPLMVDFEPTVGSRPSLNDCLNFIDAYRKIGGVTYLVYLPHWYWQQIGSPSLSGLESRGMKLVSSHYTSYGDNGPGWASYGGMTPAVWQYSDNTGFNGFSIDFNAFKGTLAEFKSIVNTGKLPPPPPPATDRAGNPVSDLRVHPRFTQADLSWHTAAGAVSYRIKVYGHYPLHKIQQFDTAIPATTVHNLNKGGRYTVTVLANPASPAFKLGISKRSSIKFTTQR